MTIATTGTRRAILKASVAIATMTTAGGILAACGETAPTEPAVDPNPVVETKHGKVKGALENGIATFKGVRYGADTTLSRFQLPKPPEPWTETQDALAYPTSAPQPPSGDGGGLFASWRPNPPLSSGEDCLFLNVWTPAADDKKRPVLVWFHGGGFTTGSGSSYAYDGVNLARRGDVVVVTTNHRLNQFGYLNLAAYGDQFADSGAVGAHDKGSRRGEACAARGEQLGGHLDHNGLGLVHVVLRSGGQGNSERVGADGNERNQPRLHDGIKAEQLRL